MRCKWYQVERSYPASKTCDKPIPRLTKLERRRTGKEYPDDPQAVVCSECVVNDYFAIPLIVGLSLVPLIAVIYMKNEE